MLSKISSKQQYAPQSDESTLWSLDRHDLWRDDVSSVNFLNRPASNHKKTDSYENTRSLAWNWFDVPLIVAWLRICSSQIMQHIQVFVTHNPVLVNCLVFSWIFDADSVLSEHVVAQSCQDEWHHRTSSRCKPLKSLFSPSALYLAASLAIVWIITLLFLLVLLSQWTLRVRTGLLNRICCTC